MKSSFEYNNKILSVYLRIRPLDKSSSKSSSSKDNLNSTIKIIDTTTIRSYRPSQSNASKSARGGSRPKIKEHTFNKVFASHSVSDTITHFSIFIFFILLM